MLDKQTLFKKWENIGGITYPIRSEENLFGFFQSLRPDEVKLEHVFKGLKKGKEIFKRLQDLFKKTSKLPLVVGFSEEKQPQKRNPQLDSLFIQHFNSMAQIAFIMDENSLGSSLKNLKIEYVDNKKLVDSIILDDNSLSSWIHDVVSDFIFDLPRVESEIFLLKEAFFSIANDYFLAHYLMWPLYYPPESVKEPFLAYYYLFFTNVYFALSEEGVCYIFGEN